jgi:hypothetical protein
VASGVFVCGNVVLLVLMCARPLCFRRYNVLAVREYKHDSLFSNGRCWKPPYFAKIWLVRPL